MRQGPGAGHNILSTCPGRDQYVKKRSETLNCSAHWVEIDLLRQGYRHAASRTRSDFFSSRLGEPLPFRKPANYGSRRNRIRFVHVKGSIQVRSRGGG